MGEEGGHPAEGVGAPGEHRGGAQQLGGQGQDQGWGAPVQSREDGVHPRGAQEPLQPQGEARGWPVEAINTIIMNTMEHNIPNRS